MDYKSYITKVEKLIQTMTESQKNDWIFAQARTIDEKKRKDFLDSLMGKKEVRIGLSADEIFEWCKQVEDESIYFLAESYEYYEYGDWDSDYEVAYRDIFGASDYLVKAINAACQLVMSKEYGVAYRLLDRLLGLEFHVKYDEDYVGFEDTDWLSLEDLADEDLISIDFREMGRCLLYACYQTTKGYGRRKALYEYLTERICEGIAVTDIFSYGPEKIEDADAFMGEWCKYLTEISGDRAAQLLVDACVYIGGDDNLLKMARKHVNNHPFLFKVCCERIYQCGDYAECIAIAKEAVDRIDGAKVIRANISDIGARASEEAGDEPAAWLFYWEAFYSEPDSRRLLRLYKSDDKAIIHRALERVNSLGAASKENYAASEEQRVTTLNEKNQKVIYQFLLGGYADVLKECQTKQNYLGWSYDLKGAIVPLLLLILKEDASKKTNAERNLIENVKHTIRFEERDGVPFEEYFSVWRQSYNMPDEDRRRYVEWLSDEIDKRVEHVVGGGHRKSYYKAAELIVVLGAILEERGQVNGMRNLVEHYKARHSRKRAFRSEIDQLAR